MKRRYLKPSVEYINFYSEEDITTEGGGVPDITISNPEGSEGDDYEDW